MKIGTLNYHHAYNYGAVFQAAALQHIIQTLGHDCEIIDYRNPSVEKQYQYKSISLDRNLLKNLRANLVLLPFISQKKKNFENWFRSYIKTVEVKKNELSIVSEKFDKVIVGSDQVWNMKCQGEDLSFLLDFLPDQKKIAYAASFGTYSIDQKYNSVFIEHLKHIPQISVREERGADIVEELIGIRPPCTMDPVLLAGKSYWESRMDGISLPVKDYIFVYQLGHGTGVPNYAKKLSNKLRLPIVFITGHIGNIVCYRLKDKNYSSASPELFLKLLAESSYVVTNSFHATVLAMAFRKSFNAIVEGNGKATYNTRIYSLLERYSLENRILEVFTGEHIEEVDFGQYDSMIECDRQASLSFLRDAFQGSPIMEL